VSRAVVASVDGRLALLGSVAVGPAVLGSGAGARCSPSARGAGISATTPDRSGSPDAGFADRIRQRTIGSAASCRWPVPGLLVFVIPAYWAGGTVLSRFLMVVVLDPWLDRRYPLSSPSGARVRA